MTASITIGGRGRGPRYPAPPLTSLGAAERALLAQLEARIPAVIVAQRQRQSALNAEARSKARSAERT
jgi:hypothetical protein